MNPDSCCRSVIEGRGGLGVEEEGPENNRDDREIGRLGSEVVSQTVQEGEGSGHRGEVTRVETQHTSYVLNHRRPD